MALSRPRQLQTRPRLIITEQPASSKLRFRYSSEGMSGSILGALSRPENPTFPTIKILGYTGFVRIIVSCVTKDEPYRPHPHKLVGREHCHDGVFIVCTEITDENNEYQFRNLGIQCVKRCEVDEALCIREAMEIDPFSTGFSHRKKQQCIDMSAIRLAIQVHPMYPSGSMLKFRPVVSHVIHDKKNAGELHISYPSHCSGPACGGIQVTVLSEKVIRKNIVVVFYQDDEQMWWEQEASIKRVHKQVTILFNTPPYVYPNITNKVKVHFQLRRLSDGAVSNSLPYIYHPNYEGNDATTT
ncbi:embryonic polarity protein dorsal-like [Manduca sexta]|uniref:embryonic polarity protein dorsal-like n=1 Tax=Manduca sexta TaxID=7130 RepID=UPI0011842C5D|nr:embryonic polarity protein dorsal-like [Manduca sexta]